MTKKLMVYLDDERHEDLRVLAFKRRTTMAALIRQALEVAFEDELDAVAGERTAEQYARDPEEFMTLEEFKKSLGLDVRSPRQKKRTA